MSRMPRYMVQAPGRSRKLQRLSHEERWAFIAGALALANEAAPRGSLLVAEFEAVTAEDIAHEAGVSPEAAQSMLDRLTRLGSIEETAAGPRIRNWDRFNPPLRMSDRPEATRERKRQQRARDRKALAQDEAEGRANQLTMDGGSSSPLRSVTNPGFPTPPPETGGRQRDRIAYRQWLDQYATETYPHADHDQAVYAIGQAARYGARDGAAVHAHLEQHFPHLIEGAA